MVCACMITKEWIALETQIAWYLAKDFKQCTFVFQQLCIKLQR